MSAELNIDQLAEEPLQPRLHVVDNDAGDMSTPVDNSTPPKKKGGRPPGSKNKTGASAREVLARQGLPGIKALCAIAAGRVIYRSMKDGKAREKIVPELADMIVAQKAILSRLVPELSAVAMTPISGIGENGELLKDDPAEGLDRAGLARTIIALLGSAAPQPASPDARVINGHHAPEPPAPPRSHASTITLGEYNIPIADPPPEPDLPDESAGEAIRNDPTDLSTDDVWRAPLPLHHRVSVRGTSGELSLVAFDAATGGMVWHSYRAHDGSRFGVHRTRAEAEAAIKRGHGRGLLD